MVAVIHSSSSLRNILNYNEQKVKTGVALCLEAGYYPKEAVDLSFQQKLLRLEKLTELNQRTKVNSVHISLNFDPSEQLSEAKMKVIAADYLARIGFGRQPYLLYQHWDSGHPHLHLVTTNIKPDGSRISLHNLGKNESEKARREIENLYGLVVADNAALQEAYHLKPIDAKRVCYGRSETKRAIGNVLNAIVDKYRYASLPELNAILKLYNVMADNGSENSRTRRHEGLVYRLLNEQGQPVGTPIKASLFYNQPGFKILNKRFVANRVSREPFKARIRNAIDLTLLSRGRSINHMVKELKNAGIDTVIRQNNEGLVYGMTYVDHTNKVVFNGSDLGKQYSAKAILERCQSHPANEKKQSATLGGRADSGKIAGEQSAAERSALSDVRGRHPAFGTAGSGLAGALLEQQEAGQMDWHFKSTRRKKKRRRLRPG